MLLIAVMALSQTTLLFPRWAVGPAPPLPADAVPLHLERPGDVILHGHLRSGGRSGTPILGFGDNAQNAGDMALFLYRSIPDHPVAAFHYRG